MSFMQTALLWAFVFILIGASTYGLDKKWGVKFYGKIRRLWTPPATGIPPMERGFLVNRSNVQRWKIAGIVGVIYTVIMIGIRHEDPGTEIMLWFVVTPATFIGFLVGPKYMKFKKWRDEKVLRKLDQMEAEGKDLGDIIGDKFDEAKKAGSDLFKKVVSSVKPEQTPAPAAPPPEPPVDPAEEERKARECINRFAGGGR